MPEQYNPEEYELNERKRKMLDIIENVSTIANPRNGTELKGEIKEALQILYKIGWMEGITISYEKDQEFYWDLQYVKGHFRSLGTSIRHLKYLSKDNRRRISSELGKIENNIDKVLGVGSYSPSPMSEYRDKLVSNFENLKVIFTENYLDELIRIVNNPRFQ